MYLKSNSRDISSQITIPNSFNTIEQCNPNLILLKVIAKNLIMWKNIDNTPDFILGQIPELIRFIYENSLHNVHERYYLVYNVAEIDYHTITVIFASIMTGAVVAMGMRYAGTGDKRAVQTIQWHI
jgi:anaphase-promoting complex subunit 1